MERTPVSFGPGVFLFNKNMFCWSQQNIENMVPCDFASAGKIMAPLYNDFVKANKIVSTGAVPANHHI